MKTSRIYDIAFQHTISSSGQKSKNVIWTREGSFDTCWFTDSQLPLVDSVTCKTKIAWLVEPPSIMPETYKFIKENHTKFSYILTFDKSLLSLGKNFLYYPFFSTWIEREKSKVYKKDKLVSIICSNKRMTPGHELRHWAIDKYKGLIDVFGHGYAPIEHKLLGLERYAFNIVIENISMDTYFTEKIIDCFRTGTIPIYWGPESVGDFFDKDGFLFFNTLDDLGEILKNIKMEDYSSRLSSVEDNYTRAIKYDCAEDWMFDKYPFLFQG